MPPPVWFESGAVEGDGVFFPPLPSPPLLLLAVGPSPQPLLPVQLREWLGRLPGPEAGQAAAAFSVRPCSGGLGRARAAPQLSRPLESLPALRPVPFHLTPLDTQASPALVWLTLVYHSVLLKLRLPSSWASLPSSLPCSLHWLFPPLLGFI